MTVPTRWREAYRAQYAAAELLKAEVDQHLRGVPLGWYSDSRVKKEDSFYQKIETGRVSDLLALEDFFGALVVVPLPSDIPTALDFLGDFFEVRYQRPDTPGIAKHPASTFRFNDIRLYGTLRSDESMPPTRLEEIVFEIQVRTFFQHAWSSATHDLVYKHPSFSWARNRVAAQIKAILENAEMTIDSIDHLETSPLLPAVGSPETELNLILDIVQTHWRVQELPPDVKRMAETLSDVCLALSLSANQLSELFERGRADLGGHPDGWSPYQCLLDYYSRYEPQKLAAVLRKRSRRPKQFFVTPEILSRIGLRADQCVSASE